MRILYLSIFISFSLLIACEKKNSTDTEPTPYAAEVTAADEVVAVSAVEMSVEDTDSSDYTTHVSPSHDEVAALFEQEVITDDELKLFYQSLFDMDSVGDYIKSWECFDLDDSQTIVYVGKRLGMFTCTNTAIENMLNHTMEPALSLRKEGVMQAMENYNSTLENGFNGSAYDALFPVNIFWAGDRESRFNYVNKNAVIWLAANVIPTPDTKINGINAQSLYDRILKNLCRSMMFYYLHLHNKLDIEKEVWWYHLMISNEDELAAGDWLELRYNQQEYPQPGISMDYKQTPAYFIGFWLRRNIDGSDHELRNALEKILKLYDSAWLEKLSQQFQ